MGYAMRVVGQCRRSVPRLPGLLRRVSGWGCEFVLVGCMSSPRPPISRVASASSDDGTVTPPATVQSHASPCRPPSRPEPGAIAVAANALNLVASVPSRVHAGERVPVTLRLLNVSDRPLCVSLPGNPTAFDVTVAASPDGAPLWRRMEGQAVGLTSSMGPPLAPGRSVVFTTQWDQRTHGGLSARPGVYFVRGVLDDVGVFSLDGGRWSGRITTAPARLEIAP